MPASTSPQAPASPVKSSYVDKGINQVKGTVTYVVNVVDSVTPAFAKDTANYFYTTASNVSQSVQQSVNATTEFASQKVNDAVTLGKNAVVGAQNTLSSLTPDPVLNLINSTLTNANALRSDPVGTVKPYVPDFVVQVGNKTFEVVSNTADSAKRTVGETQGFIVTKVNGTVDYITHIPQVETLVAELKKLTGRESAAPASA